MQEPHPADSRVSREQQRAMLIFAREHYPSYGIDRIHELFDLCQTQFPEHPQLAKLYVYFQTTCHERRIQEPLFLETFDIAELFKQYPSLSIFEGMDNTIVNRVRQLDRLSIDQRADLLRELTFDDHIPFIRYAQNFFDTHSIQIREPIDKVSDKHHRWAAERTAAYTDWQQLLFASSISSSRLYMYYFHLNPNHIMNDKTTPLTIATTRGNPALIEMLIRHNAAPTLAILRLNHTGHWTKTNQRVR